MAVKIRLKRMGRRNRAFFRIVAADERSPRDGRFIEAIGFYNPRTEPETFSIAEDRALHWLGTGAQPTPPVERLLNSQGTLARLERLKNGEPLDGLLAEAAAQAEEKKKESATKATRPAKPAARKSAAPSKDKDKEPSPAPDEPVEQELPLEPQAEADAAAPLHQF